MRMVISKFLTEMSLSNFRCSMMKVFVSVGLVLHVHEQHRAERIDRGHVQRLAVPVLEAAADRQQFVVPPRVFLEAVPCVCELAADVGGHRGGVGASGPGRRGLHAHGPEMNGRGAQCDGG